MTPTRFAEANTRFGPPSDLVESQCSTIWAYRGVVSGGSVDGCDFVVTAWKPSAEELKQLNAGNPVFLSCIGGLPPHFITTDFQQAVKPS